MACRFGETSYGTRNRLNKRTENGQPKFGTGEAHQCHSKNQFSIACSLFSSHSQSIPIPIPTYDNGAWIMARKEKRSPSLENTVAVQQAPLPFFRGCETPAVLRLSDGRHMSSSLTKYCFCSLCMRVMGRYPTPVASFVGSYFFLFTLA